MEYCFVLGTVSVVLGIVYINNEDTQAAIRRASVRSGPPDLCPPDCVVDIHRFARADTETCGFRDGWK